MVQQLCATYSTKLIGKLVVWISTRHEIHAETQYLMVLILIIHHVQKAYISVGVQLTRL